MSKKASWVFFGLSIVVTLLIRFWGIGEKPVHHDESINGWFVTQMWLVGYYRYDPTNYHGPLLFYLFQWLEPLFGSSIQMMRGVTSLASALTAIFFLAEGLLKKRWVFLVLGIGLVLSPAAEFFGRSAIHEALFVLAQLAVLWGAWQQTRTGWLWAWIGFCVMLLLKETWAVFVLAAVFSALFTRVWQDPLGKEVWRQLSESWSRIGHVVATGLIAVFVMFSGFLQNPQGVLDFFRAFLPWAKTGSGGAGHEKPATYWLELMARNEPLTLALLVICLCGLARKNKKVQFFSALGVFHFLLYSIIPYKTPWCLLTFQITLFFGGGLVLEEFCHRSSIRIRYLSMAILLGVGVSRVSVLDRLSWQSPIDLSHPYVYVQTKYPIKELTAAMEKNAALLIGEKIEVGTTETWPFPWLLRRFAGLKFTSPHGVPDLKAAIIILDRSEQQRVNPILQETHVAKIIETRQARESAVVYVRKDLVKALGVM